MRIKKQVWFALLLFGAFLFSADCDEVVAWLWYHAIVGFITFFAGYKCLD